MPASRRLLPIALSALLLALGACATTSLPPGVYLPPDAVENTRTEANGDVITEYRVNGDLRVVQVKPLRGPTYHLYMRDGQVLSSKPGDNPPQTYFKLFSW
ncbi:MAG TPA: DUF2782 domain-containing protein [Luteimonas sp.]|nr:DUF2782 domain-containing protein [Luteimonas sp.]HRO26885.1 DUF2782 domain-containing protein [Luteimonas sp.]HRP72329.1 DUF2782 domain-containing protein [Luteimonas sp.]